MFFRGKKSDASLGQRFQTAPDGFTFLEEGDHHSAHVVANAERVVDLFHVLLNEMPPAVDVVVDDRRAGKAWKGEGLALPDVRDTLGRLKVPLATHGGVEFSVYTPEDQLSLNPVLELFIYSRTDRWLYILQGKGLEEQRAVRTKSWKLSRKQFPPAPDLSSAIAAAADRLGLAAA